MGAFRTKMRVENIADRKRGTIVDKVLVDSGAENTWLPEETLASIGIKPEKKDVAFLLANGQTITRNVGFALVRVDQAFTVDEVVFARPGDLLLLGARSLEGLNLMVDPARKRLVAAGPIPAA